MLLMHRPGTGKVNIEAAAVESGQQVCPDGRTRHRPPSHGDSKAEDGGQTRLTLKTTPRRTCTHEITPPSRWRPPVRGIHVLIRDLCYLSEDRGSRRAKLNQALI